jgi:hypothetical protein
MGDSSILGFIAAAKEAYNEYNEKKSAFVGEPKPTEEQAVGEAFAPFLRSVLDVARELWASSECETERRLMRSMSEELTRIFK